MSSLRMPTGVSNQPRIETGASILDAEIVAERAAAFGRAGEKVERAMAAFRAAPVGDPGAAAHAAEAVYEFFVLRELSGFFDHADVIETYGVPRVVLARLGAT